MLHNVDLLIVDVIGMAKLLDWVLNKNYLIYGNLFYKHVKVIYWQNVVQSFSNLFMMLFNG
jgi:hypothetical protein